MLCTYDNFFVKLRIFTLVVFSNHLCFFSATICLPSHSNRFEALQFINYILC